MKKHSDVKTSMQAHSEAKIEFYKTYLERYLAIINLASGIDEINFFDVFCGLGIYDNHKKGSPIIAYDAIVKLRSTGSGSNKIINLYVNDIASEKVSAVKEYMERDTKVYCNIQYFNLSAEQMFEHIIQMLDAQRGNSRNLIFIDPYGYKEIKKMTLKRLLEKGHTEIILFLPIHQMHRFTNHAMVSDDNADKPLKDFTDDFFGANHPIRKQKVSALEYIDYLKEELTFGKYHAASYFIEREKGKYFGLFFVSRHIYGIKKMLEVKWDLDEGSGKGFNLPQPRTLFDALIQEDLKNDNYERLEKILEEFLENPKDNKQIFELVLKHDFLPKHANEIFKKWKESRSCFKITEIATGKPANRGFYLTYDNYREENPKVMFTLS